MNETRRRSSPSTRKRPAPVNIRTDATPAALAQAIKDNLFYVQGRVPRTATRNDWYMAVAYTIRERVLHRWMSTIETVMTTKAKSVSYLSAEFLIGPQLGSHLVSLGILDEVRQAVASLGQDLDDLFEQEEEPGLGNGGLGRLAACFLDSMATLQVLGTGYGIRYEFGIFDQGLRDGWQVEETDKWLRLGSPWEIPRPQISYSVGFEGHTEHWKDGDGRFHVRWVPHRAVRGIASDLAVPGYKVNTVNLLRLWKAEAAESFDFQAFNVGDYYGAVEDKVSSENISKVLYPNDESMAGKRLRLAQQYFFVSCSLQDMMRVHLRRGNRLEDFHEVYAVQLNDTHPSVAVAEMMRLLMDEHDMEWDPAWEVTRRTFAYTNHTLLPEALEKWPLPLFGSLLPRHLEIIFEINHRFLADVRARFPGDEDRVRRMSIIDETGDRYVRMAHLASVGSHAINGVAALHTELLKRDVLRDFHEMYPDRFLNVTNGVTPRRWVVYSNPRLADLITRSIGDGWISDMERRLSELERFARNKSFRNRWRAIKRENKLKLAAVIKQQTGVVVDPDSLFDVQVKRIHEYKRQHLNALHVVTLYHRIKQDPQADVVPRTVIFAGKAAPGYYMAKLIIKLINSVAEVVNRDPDVAGRLKVVFLPDFNVKRAHAIYPAADLSEQISTAGKEASGTGNMKFSMNGALTIGTLDGANVEIRDAVGAENFFLFGLTIDEVRARWASGYRPGAHVDADPELRAVLDLVASGTFSPSDHGLFVPLVNSLLYHDPFMLLADYRSYVECQERVAAAYRDPDEWTRMSILNVARIGGFSSDRSIREYCERIWKVEPVPIPLG
ncbi:MAG: glycogen/starch/alpha-glucan phosphorylase [Gemmatimonadetes bacterium]|nr:glycogen/starch/alpha-glucan phosphorylase [Gemmatimonadota bacterium]